VTPLLQVFRRVGQIALCLAAERQVVERDEDGEPVLRAAGRVQGLGEQLRRAVVICLAESDLAEEIAHERHVQQVLCTLGSGEPPSRALGGLSGTDQSSPASTAPGLAGVTRRQALTGCHRIMPRLVIHSAASCGPAGFAGAAIAGPFGTRIGHRL
jgi:hypothetical protein